MEVWKKLWNVNFFTIFVSYLTSNCYVIIEYTANLIKPSYSSLKTVLNRVPALVPKFKIDQNMLFLISSRAFRPTRGIVIQMSVCMVYGVWCMVYGVWCHKICTQAKFKNGRSYQHNFFFNRLVWMRGTQRVKKKLKKVWKKGVKSWKKVWNC